ncbi:dipeptide/oligopeptide/nickel ABC transporter permease/ATP-binding protein [Tomitella fengzijianii]|uniref:Dipeptide/oligopeptide/nickel ABC transporter permease/ATP-binding protein n=1 Tax=Tomitella fengzijianii TaxID=2597660 RepID=A0A516X8X8_9ACTN|nr:dipeptide/oligopeptide/nickel ABC transporter permease/ATP-binding protein [Tomitella fengzijianii]
MTTGAHRRRTVRAIVRNPMALSGVLLLVLVLVAFFAAVVIGWVAPEAAFDADLRNVNAPAGSPGHLLGTDSSGRDVLVRLVVATKATMISAAIALGVALAIGIPGGLIAGYYGKGVDRAANWVSNMVMSLPSMVVLMAIISGYGTSMVVTMTALGCMMAPAVFRLIRAQVKAIRNELYIDAAKVSGLRDHRIIARHVLQAVRGPLVLMVTMMSGIAITVQTGLDFIGLGDENTITWGGMLSEGFSALHVNNALLLWPGLAMSLAVAAFFLLGNGVRDALQRSDQPASSRRSGRRRAGAVEPDGHESLGAAGTRDGVAAPAEDEIVAVRDLTVRYGADGDDAKDVVSGVTLTLRRGRTLGLVGESGSGKTQSAFALLDLLPGPARLVSGEAWIDGVDVRRLPARERGRRIRDAVAYVPQEPMSNLDPAFTIGSQLIEPMRHRGMTRKDARAKAARLLGRMGIADPQRVMRSYPHQVSGGMAQRVLIAGAISCEPRILVADEPTTALDVTVQREILDILRGLRDEAGMTILLVTHDLGVVADLCDDVAVMRQGRVLEHATVHDFFARPRHEYSRTLLASVPDEEYVRPPYRDDAAAMTEGVWR